MNGEQIRNGVLAFLPPMSPQMTWRVLIGIVVAGLVGFSLFAISDRGFVFAADVDKKVEEAVKPVKEEIAEIKQQTEQTERRVININDQLDVILMDYYAKRLRDLARRRCKTPLEDVAERDRLDEQIAQDRRQYRKYAKEEFNYPRCSEV